MSFCIRRVKVPDDYEGIARVISCSSPDPVTVEMLMEEDRKIPETGHLWEQEGKLGGHDRQRWVAVDEQEGSIAAYAYLFRTPWMEPGEIWFSVIVLPPYRKQGIGRTLYGCVESWAVEKGAERLLVFVREQDAASLAFAGTRSFDEERRSFESKLELAGFDRPELYEAVEKLRTEGIRFLTLADEPGEESERKLYELCRDTHPDIPGYTGGFPDPERWREWTLELTGSSPETTLIAADGDRFVALVHLLWNEESHSMYHEYTCTDRSYRGRGIALALKLLGIEAARKRGARYLRTHNDSCNAPMLRINRDLLGFEAEPGLCRMLKKLDEGKGEKRP